jgi:hypothetical protein
VAEVLNGLYAGGLKITEVRIKESSLEEVFVQLTGRTIEMAPEAEPAGDTDATGAPEEELHEV